MRKNSSMNSTANRAFSLTEGAVSELVVYQGVGHRYDGSGRNISLFLVVDQPMRSVFHPTLCTKARACGLGQRVDQLGHCILHVLEFGWMEQPYLLEWFRKLFLPAVSRKYLHEKLQYCRCSISCCIIKL